MAFESGYITQAPHNQRLNPTEGAAVNDNAYRTRILFVVAPLGAVQTKDIIVGGLAASR